MIYRARQLVSDETGSALLVSVIVGFVFLSAVIWFSNWGFQQGRTAQYAQAAQRSFQYADSGISATRPWLKSPAANAQLAPGTTYTFTMGMPSGRCDVALYRTSPDSSLVDAYSTGYYFMTGGATVDPVTHQSAQISAIHAIIRVTNVASYLAAVPGDLSISEGASASGGIVYAQNLTFLGTQGDPPSTQIGEADYSSTVQPTANPSFVVFHSTPAHAQPLSFQPAFASLDSTMRSFYQNNATVGATPSFSGMVAPGSDSSIYFVTGDVDVAQGSGLTVSGAWVLYATGNINIHGNITTASTGWAAFVSEKDIRVTTDAPDSLSLSGTFLCNGVFAADTSNHFRNPGIINLTGGMVVMSGIDLTTAYSGAKNYTYFASPSPGIILPNVTDMLQKNVYLGSSFYK